MEEMIVLGKAVRRGLKTPLMIGDMPMGSYEASNELAIQNAQRLVKETGCQVVKLEAGGVSVERARAIVRAGIPVMGHVGLTPQTATALGGYKAQGKTAQDAIKLCEDALALQSVGCFAIVFEAVPAAITEAIVEQARDPDDRDRRRPRDLRPGPRLPRPARDHHRPHGEIRQALRRDPRGDGRGASAATARRSAPRHFPGPEHVYAVEPAELAEFRRYLDQESLASQKAWDWEPLSIVSLSPRPPAACASLGAERRLDDQVVFCHGDSGEGLRRTASSSFVITPSQTGL